MGQHSGGRLVHTPARWVSVALVVGKMLEVGSFGLWSSSTGLLRTLAIAFFRWPRTTKEQKPIPMKEKTDEAAVGEVSSSEQGIYATIAATGSRGPPRCLLRGAPIRPIWPSPRENGLALVPATSPRDQEKAILANKAEF